jgi:hypothetical protein
VPRESVYDKAWLGSVNPGDRLVIDEALWRQFPKEYAVLAYLQEKIGGRVKRDMPAGLKGEALQELNGRGEAWLAGTLDKPWTRKQAPGSTMAGCRARLRQPRSWTWSGGGCAPRQSGRCFRAPMPTQPGPSSRAAAGSRSAGTPAWAGHPIELSMRRLSR